MKHPQLSKQRDRSVEPLASITSHKNNYIQTNKAFFSSLVLGYLAITLTYLLKNKASVGFLIPASVSSPSQRTGVGRPKKVNTATVGCKDAKDTNKGCTTKNAKKNPHYVAFFSQDPEQREDGSFRVMIGR